MKNSTFKERQAILAEAMAQIEKYPKEHQQQALNFLLDSFEGVNPREEKAKIKGAPVGRSKSSGIRSKVESYVRNADFFLKPKGLNEVSQKLAQDGFNVPVTHLSPILIVLVRNGTLSRHKDSDGKYVYYKKENS